MDAKGHAQQATREPAAPADAVQVGDVVPAFGTPSTPAGVLALQRSAGNRATGSALGRHDASLGSSPSAMPPMGADRAVQAALSRAVIQRQDHGDGGATATQSNDLATEYAAALTTARQTGDFQRAAELLNGFNQADIERRLAELTPQEIEYLHLAAVTNPSVGPQSQVAQLTGPASRPAAQSDAAAVPAAPARAIADMTPNERMMEAYRRADINQAVREKILAVLSPEAFVAAMVGFVVAFAVSQLTPVGWAADMALAVTALFIGTALFSAINHLINFASARSATTDAQLDWAGQEFARAVAEIEIDTILILITHRAGGTGGAGAPPAGGGAQQMVLALSNGERIMVAAETVPAAVSGQLGIAAGGTAMAMQGRGGGGGRPGGRDFEPPIRDHQGKAGGELPINGDERANAVNSWSREELELAADELEQSIAARQAEMARLGEANVGAQGQPIGANHRVRIEQEVDLLRAIRKKLSGS